MLKTGVLFLYPVLLSFLVLVVARVDKPVVPQRVASSRTTVTWWDETRISDEDFIRFTLSSDTTQQGMHRIYKRIQVKNNSKETLVYKISSMFDGHVDKVLHEAINLTPVFPGRVKVGSGTERTISVVMTIHDKVLSDNMAILGPKETNASEQQWTGLQGYLVVDDGAAEEPVNLAWKLLDYKTGEKGFASSHLSTNASIEAIWLASSKKVSRL